MEKPGFPLESLFPLKIALLNTGPAQGHSYQKKEEAYGLKLLMEECWYLFSKLDKEEIVETSVTNGDSHHDNLVDTTTDNKVCK